jgi:hypothetical protein
MKLYLRVEIRTSSLSPAVEVRAVDAECSRLHTRKERVYIGAAIQAHTHQHPRVCDDLNRHSLHTCATHATTHKRARAQTLEQKRFRERQSVRQAMIDRATAELQRRNAEVNNREVSRRRRRRRCKGRVSTCARSAAACSVHRNLSMLQGRPRMGPCEPWQRRERCAEGRAARMRAPPLAALAHTHARCHQRRPHAHSRSLSRTAPLPPTRTRSLPHQR